ncbi:1-aminocyclopropane-1-carboxylate oxidase 5-like [Nymphaea colorata]|nr:1-aminocyclopropane-1-carboxylate oxidase 5-like [Nymphaea colorata]
MEVPVIDFSKFHGEERAKVMVQIHSACQNWGFFQLINHGIPEALLEGVKEVCIHNYKFSREEMFKNSQPVKEVEKTLSGKETPQKIETLDWEDAFMLYYKEESEEWPSEPLNFKKTMVEFSNRLKELAVTILQIMDENLGLEKGYLNEKFKGNEGQPFFATKVSHYPPCPRPDLIDGLRAHTDAGGIILLYQDDQVGGLQVLKDGHWVDVKPIPNTIVIDIGDQLETISNGKFFSAPHKVLATKDGNRRSVASFYNPAPSAVISPAPSLLHGDASIDYPTFVSADYMRRYMEEKFLPKEPRINAMKY